MHLFLFYLPCKRFSLLRSSTLIFQTFPSVALLNWLIVLTLDVHFIIRWWLKQYRAKNILKSVNEILPRMIWFGFLLLTKLMWKSFYEIDARTFKRAVTKSTCMICTYMQHFQIKCQPPTISRTISNGTASFLLAICNNPGRNIDPSAESRSIRTLHAFRNAHGFQW